MLPLPAELVLVGHSPRGIRYGPAVRLAVAAGELAELALGSKIQFDRNDVWLLDGTPTMQPTLDALIQRLIRRGKPLSLSRCLKDQAGYYDWHLNQLTAAGLLRHEENKILGIFPRWKYVPEQQARDEVLNRLWCLLNGWSPPDPRTMALAGILYGSELGHIIIPHRQDLRILRKIGKTDPLGSAIHRILASSRSAAAAVTTAGAGAFISST